MKTDPIIIDQPATETRASFEAMVASVNPILNTKPTTPMNTLDEVRQIITDQITRHVAAPGAHRAWLAKDIADRVCAVVADTARDMDRLNWLELTASGIQWQLDHTGPITREAIDRALSRAEAEETDDIAEEIQRITRSYGPANNTDPSENHP